MILLVIIIFNFLLLFLLFTKYNAFNSTLIFKAKGNNNSTLNKTIDWLFHTIQILIASFLKSRQQNKSLLLVRLFLNYAEKFCRQNENQNKVLLTRLTECSEERECTTEAKVTAPCLRIKYKSQTVWLSKKTNKQKRK